MMVQSILSDGEISGSFSADLVCNNAQPLLIGFLVSELCCVKCREPESRNEDLRVVKNGVEKLIESTNNDRMKEYLQDRVSTNSIIRIHKECQKDIYNELKRKSKMDVHEESKVPKVVTRSSINSFNWTEN